MKAAIKLLIVSSVSCIKRMLRSNKRQVLSVEALTSTLFAAMLLALRGKVCMRLSSNDVKSPVFSRVNQFSGSKDVCCRRSSVTVSSPSAASYIGR